MKFALQHLFNKMTTIMKQNWHTKEDEDLDIQVERVYQMCPWIFFQRLDNRISSLTIKNGASLIAVITQVMRLLIIGSIRNRKLSLLTRSINTMKYPAQQYLLHEGLKRYGKEGRSASKKEIKQLHERVCFRPINVASLTMEERRKAQWRLSFSLKRKTDRAYDHEDSSGF